MHTHALTQALTLYRSETLSFEQAAAHAGRTKAEFAAALRRHGVERHEAPVNSGGDRARAD